MKAVKLVLSSFVFFWALQSSQAFAMEFKFQPVTKNVYAFIGPLNDRTPENLGLNDNIGLVVTDAGAVLIDSGAGTPAAKALEKAAKAVTSKKIIAVINTGSQDHRWLGNGYFASKGATIYALARTVKTQKAMGQGEIEHMTKVSSAFATTKPVTAPKPFAKDQANLTIGDVKFEIKYLGDAHFPGDAVVWLPKQQVLFSGDLIYVDRMLGIHPFSNVTSWQKAFHKAQHFPAKFIVPGHGQVCDWQKAKQDTGNYLDKLVRILSTAAEEMMGVGQAVSANADWPEFKHLKHYKTWHKTNVNRAYLQFEQSL